MLIINNRTAHLDHLQGDHVWRILQLRRGLIDLATFLVVGPHDSIPAIEAEAGFSIDPEYPPWEWVLDHHGIFEAPIITSDSGSCVVLIVPDQDGIDPALLSLLRNQAEPATVSET